MLRNVAAALAGLIVAAAIYTMIREFGEFLYAPPAGLDFSDPESVDRYHAQLPIGAHLFIFAKPVVAAFAGVLVACYAGSMDASYFGAVVGGIVLAYSIAFFIALPHPLWLVAATLLGIVISTYIAIRIAPGSGGRPLQLFDNESDSG